MESSDILKRYLEERKKELSIVHVHLVNGVRLNGQIRDFDDTWVKIGMPKQRAIVVNLANVTSFSLGAPELEDNKKNKEQ